MAQGGVSREELEQHELEHTLGSVRKDPLVLYGMFQEITQQIFNVSDWSDTTWSRKQSESDILIASEYVWDDTHPEFRPAVFISMPELSFSSYTRHNDGQTGFDMVEGVASYTRKIEGTVQWNIIGETRGEAIRIGTDILTYLDVFSSKIAKDFCFEEFYVVKFKPAVVIKEDREKIRTTITAKFTAQESWTLKHEGPKLKELHFSAGQVT